MIRRALVLFVSIVGISLNQAAQAADTKDSGNAAKLVGTWTLVKVGKDLKVDGMEVPKELSISCEFTKDGKAIMKIGTGGKEDKEEGTYKVDGNKLTLTKKSKDGKDDINVMVIKTLTASSLIIANEKMKQEMEFKKK